MLTYNEVAAKVLKLDKEGAIKIDEILLMLRLLRSPSKENLELVSKMINNIEHNMSVKFNAENHSYQSVDPNENIDWVSVTKFVGRYKQPFDPIAQSEKSSKNKRSKWYGMDPLRIQEIWAAESTRSTLLGNWYHDQRELDVSSLNTLRVNGVDVPIMKSIYDNNVKYAPDQNLIDGVYPEHFIYLKSAGICGQSDRVDVVNSFVDITDYKTNKEIKTQGYTDWRGVTQKMLAPVDHLDDCNLNHYTLQLSFYMYMILRQNPNLKPGKLSLQHVKFAEDTQTDEFGYPVTLKDIAGKPIVKEVKTYIVPYLRSEVVKMLEHYKATK